MAGTSYTPENSLVGHDADERVAGGQHGCADQLPLQAHHISENERNRPGDCGRHKREPLPSPEHEAEQNEDRDHQCPSWDVNRTSR